MNPGTTAATSSTANPAAAAPAAGSERYIVIRIKRQADPNGGTEASSFGSFVISVASGFWST